MAVHLTDLDNDYDLLSAFPLIQENEEAIAKWFEGVNPIGGVSDGVKRWATSGYVERYDGATSTFVPLEWSKVVFATSFDIVDDAGIGLNVSLSASNETLLDFDNGAIFRVNSTDVIKAYASGFAGVNTANPAYAWDVTGDINFTGTLYNNGSAISLVTQTYVDAEDASLQSQIDTLATTDTSLQTQITSLGSTDTNLQTQINTLTDLAIRTTANFKGNWDSTATYLINEQVFYNNTRYYSLINNNTNNNPATATTSWGVFVENVASAQVWANSRTLTLDGDLTGSVSIDGSQDVTLTATVDINSITLGNDTTGNYVASVETTAPLSGGAAGSESAALTLALASGYGDTQNPYASKTQNYVLAAPSTTNGAPGFRALTAADLPSHNHAISEITNLQSTLDGKLGDTENAASATQWASPMTLTLGGDLTGSVSFDGSQGVTLTATASLNSVALGADTTGDYVASVTGGSGVTATGTGESAAVNLSLATAYGDTVNPYASKTGNYVLAAPSGSSGVPSFRQLVSNDIPYLPISKISSLDTALLGKLGATENAVSASEWQTARTITLGGDLSGSVSIDGSQDVTLSAAVADNSHAHTIANVSNLQTALDGKLNLTGGNLSSNLNIAGKVGINTTNPSATLEVVAPSDQTNPLRIAGAYTGNSPLSFLLYNYSTTQNLSETTRIQAGNLGDTSNTYTRRHHSEIFFEPNGTSGGEMSFKTGGKSGSVNTVEALRLKSNQDAEFSGSITAADGILFGSDTAAANTLNDYEQGYFTPLFEAQTSNFAYQSYRDETNVYRTIGSYSSTSRASYHSSVRGFYTKIGDTVNFSLYIYVQYIGLSGVSGNLYIKGLPYTSTNNTSTHLVRAGMTACSLGYAYGWTNAPNSPYIPSNSSHIVLARLNGNTWSYITAADMGSSTDDNRLLISGTYKV